MRMTLCRRGRSVLGTTLGATLRSGLRVISLIAAAHGQGRKPTILAHAAEKACRSEGGAAWACRSSRASEVPAGRQPSEANPGAFDPDWRPRRNPMASVENNHSTLAPPPYGSQNKAPCVGYQTLREFFCRVSNTEGYFGDFTLFLGTEFPHRG